MLQGIIVREDVPDNVPKDRIFEYDFYNVVVDDAEYQLEIKKLNDPGVPELFWTPKNGGHWVATRSAEINRVLTDTEHFSSRYVSVPKEWNANPPMKPIQIDPPDHNKYRMLLMGAMSPKAVVPLGEGARRLAIELIDGFKARGECEFIGEFAQHLPIAIFMSMVDLPETDRGLLMSIAESFVRPETPEERSEAFRKLGAYALNITHQRRANPGTDLISEIGKARLDGELLDDDTIVGMLTLLLLAGLDTVAAMLGFFTRFLAMNPGHRRQLIEDPSLIPNAVEELLRRYPIALVAREVSKDVDLLGVTLKQGDMIVLPTMLDGLDERKFPEPLTVDFLRKTPIHATFGGGAHRCMGSMLARTELKIFLEEWLKRIPEFHLRANQEIEIRARTVATMVRLHVEWDPATTR